MADIKRLHYFNHQFLVEADFSDEQQYHLAMRRRHNASLHDYGVADGLAVTKSGDREITVQPGMAIDREGREMVLLDRRIISFSDAAAFPAGATVHISIAYHEEESDASTATGVTGNTRTSEKPEVRAVTAAPPGDGSLIRLAQIALTGAGNVPGNVGDRFAAGRQVATATLADGSVEESKLDAAARARLVTNGDAHNHAGGHGGQISHSALKLDGGRNPHGTTAADVGALPTTGGTLSGSLQVHSGNVGLGTTSQVASRLSIRSDDGPAGIALATLATTSSDGSGAVTGIDLNALGSGSGEKRGISCTLTGSGEKHAGYFSATSAAGSEFTQALHADASSEGSGPVMGLWSGLTGSGSGLKIGLVSEVRGGGPKRAASFLAESPGGSADTTNGLVLEAASGGTGNVLGFSLETYGSGSGQKEGLVCTVRGSGHKYGGQFRAYSDSGTADVAEGLRAVARSDGTAFARGLLVDTSGAGPGVKYGVYSTVSGNGVLWAGYFLGNVYVAGTLSKASGTFLIDHPLDPENKTLRHSFVESPEDLCLYRGKAQLDASGQASVKMPTYFAALTKEEDATVSLTAIGSKPFLAGYEWNGAFTAFTVYGEPGREVSYVVLANRDDPVIHQLRRPVEEKKGAGHFEKGQLLNPEAYGKAPRAAFSARGFETTSATPPEMGKPADGWFAAREEEHQRQQESWDKAREQQRQQMESFSREQAERRKELEESLSAPPQERPWQVAEAHPVAGVGESAAVSPASPAAVPGRASSPARAKKTGAERKKR